MDSMQSEGGDGRRRSVFVSRKALVETYSQDGAVESGEMVHRNTYSLVDYLRGLPADAVVGIYLVEDEELSEPVPEGEKRYRAPLLPPRVDRDGNETPSERVSVADAIAMLAEATVPDKVIVAKFHELFDRASATSHFDGGMITMVFDGRPCGFAFINSCRPVPVSSLGTLYETCRSQTAQLKDNLREMAPGILFSDDEDPKAAPDMYLPDGSLAGSDRRVVTPAEAAREADERGMTRIVRLED